MSFHGVIHNLIPTSIYLMKIPHDRWLIICWTIKASITRGSKQPRLSHISSWVWDILGYKTIQVLEFWRQTKFFLFWRLKLFQGFKKWNTDYNLEKFTNLVSTYEKQSSQKEKGLTKCCLIGGFFATWWIFVHKLNKSQKTLIFKVLFHHCLK
jgi:hypothetical protein